MSKTQKDWTGNSVSYSKTLGATSHSSYERELNDYYATEPKAIELLLNLEQFSNVWECACGQGHMAEVLRKKGILKKASDLIDRGYGEQLDFLSMNNMWHGDIITNPPYKFANQFIEKSMQILQEGHKLALFMPIRYTEGKARQSLFRIYPPKKIWVSSSRLKCAMNGDFDNMKGSAVSYAWFIWEKGYESDTRLGWFN
jgi:hypothetical protein